MSRPALNGVYSERPPFGTVRWWDALSRGPPALELVAEHKYVVTCLWLRCLWLRCLSLQTDVDGRKLLFFKSGAPKVMFFRSGAKVQNNCS